MVGSPSVQRGEVYLVTLNPTRGREIRMDPCNLLPHRDPFLPVDRINAGERARGTKLVTGAEWTSVGTRGPEPL